MMKNSFSHSTNRFYFIVAVLAICSIQLCAQTETGQNMAQYLFPDFTKSRVKMKVGKDLNLNLNYNTITEGLVFLQNGQFYDVVNQETVDTAYIQNRKFTPMGGKKMFEVVVDGPIPFFIENKGIVMAPGKPSAYGGTSELAASDYISGLNISSGYFNLKLPNDYVVKPSPVNWVRIKGNMSDFLNERQFLKLFPEKADQIKQFIRKSGIKFEKREDIIKLGKYCNELMK